MRGFWMVLPLLLVIALDAAFILLGQPRAYWQGDLAAVNESSRAGQAILSMGPKAFVLAAAAWAGTLLILIAVLPGMAGQVLYGAAGLIHLWGALSWVPRHARQGLAVLHARLGGEAGEVAASLTRLPRFAHWSTLSALVLLAAVTVLCWRQAGLLPSSGPPKPKGGKKKDKGKD